MSRSYFTEDAKMYHSSFPAWSVEDCFTMTEILDEKGYSVTCGVLRVGCDRKYHDAWEINREDTGRIIEELFRQRITVEVQAEGRGKASINFCYDYHADTIIGAVSRFRRNRK